jgi:serine/threonine-protein kinase HipA
LKELFRRIAFNIAVNNNDDHPRNHGVYFFQNIWRLSPLYDVVPMDSGAQTFSLAMEVGLYKREASKKIFYQLANILKWMIHQAKN